MKTTLWSACIAALAILLVACETTTPTKTRQPLAAQAVVYSTQATVVRANYQTSELTLEVPNKPGDNFFDVSVSPDVDLSQVRLGDRVTVKYIEAVFVDLFRAGDVDPGIGFAAAVGTAPPHARPARAVATGVTVVAVIEAIDYENEIVSLRGPDGIAKTFKVRNLDGLDKLKVGNKVKTTFARAWAIGITPSPVR